MTKIATFRHRYPIFSYQSFSYKFSGQNLEISFVFKIEPDIFFKPKIIIQNVNKKQLEDFAPVIDNFIFNLGMSEIPSYWKATCSPLIQIDCGYLTEEQINFWHKLLIKGMGQFFYENKIDFSGKDFVTIKVKSCALPRDDPGSKSIRSWIGGIGKARKTWQTPKFLIPLGGGKDSVVTLELLKEANLTTNLCMTNPPFASWDIAKVAGFGKPIIVKRIIDRGLLDLNKKGYLNGHVPITATLSFLYMLTAVLFDYHYVVFSNERSADQENLNWRGVNINHQYSKSLEFENDFRAYCQKYLTQKVNYFSCLRPLYELQITKLFTRYPKYFKIFKSCNAGLKTNSWCCACPKCLSVFLHLSSYLPQQKVIKIFGQNLFEQEKLLPTFRQLLGIEGYKPFECVGTIQENLAATWLVLQKIKPPLPILLQTAYQYLKSLNYNQKQADKIIESWNNKHNLPKNLEKILKQHLCHCEA